MRFAWTVGLAAVAFALAGCKKSGDDSDDLQVQGYVGSAKCEPCHGPYRPASISPTYHADWQNSIHGRTGNTMPSDASIVADADTNGRNDFKDALGLGGFADWAGYGAYTPVLGFVAAGGTCTVALGPRTFDVEKVIGVGRHKQLYLARMGNSLYVLPVLYDSMAGTWRTFMPENWYAWNDTDSDGTLDGGETVTGVRYAALADSPVTLGRTMDSWEANCAGCHATGFTSLHRNGSGEFVIQYTEDGAGCEACHGPGRIHVLNLGGRDLPDRAIVNPAKLTIAQHDDVCMSCHARGTSTAVVGGRALEFPWRPDGSSFKPGLPLAEAFKAGDKPSEPLHRLQGTHLHRGLAGSRYGAWSTGCRSCHSAHNTTNLSLVRMSVDTPSSGTRAVAFTRRSGAPGSGGLMGDATDAAGTDICEVCHTRTPHFRNDASTPDKNHNNGAACTDCHPHWRGFPLSESPGGVDCSMCHNDLNSAMTSTSATGYHHLLTAYTPGYPTGTGSKQCLSCHADHDLFRPDLNPAGGRGANLRTDIAATPTTSSGFTNTDFVNSGSGGICLSCHTQSLPKGYPQPDGTTATPAIPFTGTSAAQVAAYHASPHGGTYTVSSLFPDVGTNTFAANCSKCHNDTLNPKSAEDAQLGLNKFGNHLSDLRQVLAPLGISSPADPVAEMFCYRCHSRTTDAVGGTAKPAAGRDWYNEAPMSARAEGIYARVTAGSNHHPVGDAAASGRHHPLEGAAYNWNPAGSRHVECSDCHNPHSAGPPRTFNTAGTFAQPPAPTNAASSLTLQGVWGVNVPSWPAAWTAPAPASGYARLENSASEWQVCLKCHSGYAYNATPPAGQTDPAREFNPNNASYHAVIGASKTTQGTPVSPWTNSSAMACSDCHTTDVKTEPQGPHGSGVAHVLAGAYDATTGSGSTGHLCFKCHDYVTYVSGSGSGTGFRKGSDNLHGKHVSEKGKKCVNCHAAVPHGFNRKAMIVVTADAAPYNKGSASITSVPATFPTGNWQDSSCGTTSGCH
jgi:hypothetical protein